MRSKFMRSKIKENQTFMFFESFWILRNTVKEEIIC